MTGTGPDDGQAGERPGACTRHPDAAAGFQCCECGELLCRRCVKIGSHLVFCSLCGERAVELDELDRHGAAQPGSRREAEQAGVDRLNALRRDAYRREAVQQEAPLQDPARPPLQRSPAPETPATDAAVVAVNHAVIPAATIAMVAALLFFLLDVRSVFLTDTEALKWIGFCFVVATVLIARYGRTSAKAERQGCYTVALAGATVTAMTVRSAAHPSGDFVGLLANLLIILVVWRFATRLTDRLSFEGTRDSHVAFAPLRGDPEPRLYGTERLALEQWKEVHDVAPAPAAGSDRGRRQKGGDGGGNPVAPVARLAAVGLLAFALGEPFLLAGPPAAGERALGAMVVFLLAAGVVLAAGSGLGTLHRVRRFGGQASLGMLPGRVASAAALMVVLSALALAMPGLETRGSGALRPKPPESGRPGGDSGEADGGEGSERSARSRQQERSAAEKAQGSGDSPQSRQADRRGRDAGERPPGLSGATVSLVGQLASLGRLLRWVVVLVAALLALWGLWWLLNHLGSSRRWLSETFGRLFRDLIAGLASLFRRRRKGRRKRLVDPFADLESLRRLAPREAVVEAYSRLLAAFEILEHPRLERQTPYEFLASIPARFEELSHPARDLTEVYVRVAYGAAPIDDTDRRDALAALEALERVHRTRIAGAPTG